jgi:hypothetical protein
MHVEMWGLAAIVSVIAFRRHDRRDRLWHRRELPCAGARHRPDLRDLGVDLTAEMLEQAGERVRRERWSNVTLVKSDAC